MALVFAACPVCNSHVIVRLPPGWNSGAAIPLVGCGNPWHYATASLGDLPVPSGMWPVECVRVCESEGHPGHTRPASGNRREMLDDAIGILTALREAL